MSSAINQTRSALAEVGHGFVSADELSAIIDVTAQDWAAFARNWDDLTLDTHMADGGKYRYRRYGQFDLDGASGELTQLPHGPYRQESDVNPLNGGVERHFDPLTEEFVGSPVLRNLLRTLGDWYTRIEGHPHWNVKLHPYRIIASADTAGQPAPEGRHRDGVTFIHSLLIKRTNVIGGESGVYADSGEHLFTKTLEQTGDLLLGDDRRTLHSVTPIEPADPALAGHRDVLVIAYTRVG